MSAGSEKVVTAFVLMKADPDLPYANIGSSFAKFKKGAPNMEQAYIEDMWVITGEYDLLAKVVADSNVALLKLVTQFPKLQSSRVVTETKTLVAADSIWKM